MCPEGETSKTARKRGGRKTDRKVINRFIGKERNTGPFVEKRRMRSWETKKKKKRTSFHKGAALFLWRGREIKKNTSLKPDERSVLVWGTHPLAQLNYASEEREDRNSKGGHAGEGTGVETIAWTY